MVDYIYETFRKYCMYETFKSVFQKFIWEIYSKNIFSNMFDAIVGTSLANIAKEAFLNGQSICTEVYALVLWSVRKYL